jgi:hypothetical protein
MKMIFTTMAFLILLGMGRPVIRSAHPEDVDPASSNAAESASREVEVVESFGAPLVRDLLQITPQEWASIQDEAALTAAQRNMISRLLDSLRGKVPLSFQVGRASPRFPYDTMLEEPENLRGEMFLLHGQAPLGEVVLPFAAEPEGGFEVVLMSLATEPEPLPVGYANYSGDEIPEVRASAMNSPPVVAVCVPKGFFLDADEPDIGRLHRHIGLGVFFRTIVLSAVFPEPPGGDEQEVNLAREVPLFVSPELGLYPRGSFLAELGVDLHDLAEVKVASLSDLREDAQEGVDEKGSNVDGRSLRLVHEDREAFYSMLAAMRRLGPGDLRDLAREKLEEVPGGRFSVVPLFNRPETQKGELVMLEGIAKRLLPVEVEDADIRLRYGIDRYFQLYLFTDDSQGNPLVFCLADLPESMPLGTTSDYAERVTVAGFFLKSWMYEIEKPANGQTRETAWQFAPLLIGRSVRWHPGEGAEGEPLFSPETTIAIVAVLVVLWWVVRRRLGRGKRTASVEYRGGRGKMSRDALPEKITPFDSSDAEDDSPQDDTKSS